MATLGTIALSLATTFLTMWLIQPRLEARKARVLEAHAAREKFSSSVLTVQGACLRLRGVILDEEPVLSDVMRERLTVERERWRKQVDDSTEWMVDNVVTFALGWPVGVIRDLVAAYVGTARMVWISERDEASRLEHLAALSDTVRDALFTHVWHRARRFPSSVRKLKELVTALEQEGTAQVPAADAPAID